MNKKNNKTLKAENKYASVNLSVNKNVNEFAFLIFKNDKNPSIFTILSLIIGACKLELFNFNKLL